MKARLAALTQSKRDLYLGAFIFGVILIVSLIASESILDFMCRMVIYMLFASASNILLGFGGLSPLGQGTYFGFSAYAYLFIMVRLHMPMAAALPLALVCSILLSVLFGYLSLRTNDGMAFGFLNMGINILLFTAVQKMQIVGSDTGITGATRFVFASTTRGNFYLCLGITLVCIVAIWLFYKTPFAAVLKSSRENATRLTFLGYNTKNVRLVAYTISAFFCAIAGLMYAMRNMGAFPTMISNNASMDALIMCLVGGMYSFIGPVLGAIIITAINVQLPIVTNYYQAVMGVIVVLCVLFLQGGLLRDKTTRDFSANIGGRVKKEVGKHE
jgi:branched-chain amino acid transport system permease protein